jgi:hypothetical protein
MLDAVGLMVNGEAERGGIMVKVRVGWGIMVRNIVGTNVSILLKARNEFVTAYPAFCRSIVN